MFDTLLVANRGEIAVRILRTARDLGLKTVAVYSDADAAAPHVRLADVAVRLGPAAASESYLRPELVLHAASETGAGAIHPGYGFLSENAQFAREVEAAGIAFVGPTAAHLSVFGDKHQAREAAKAAGVPLVAGSGLLGSVDEALAAASVVGYPVMVKAVGGGGGIGMQACADADELVAAFDRVQRLAAASFGSAGVFLERFVSRARHLEVQVFGDGAGRVVSLGDRDCSLQRRNQKVVEEAPAPALPDEVRAMLHESARALTASVSYRSAGTVEYVYDVDRGEASFLEVNTRLQVEHPVTEAVTRVDLVAWMLQLAQGDSSFLDEVPDEGPAIEGHAVEVRVYAEDPRKDYQPSAGPAHRGRLPRGPVRPGRRLGRDRAAGDQPLRPDARQGHRARGRVAPRRSRRRVARSRPPGSPGCRRTSRCCARPSGCPTCSPRRTPPGRWRASPTTSPTSTSSARA